MSIDPTDRTLSRKERERQFKRNEIVSAARIVFARRGFANATLDEIAEMAEFGKGTLYNYFSSKEELFETVLADGLDEIMEIATETCDGVNPDAHSAYRAFASRMLAYLFNNSPMHALIMRETHKMERNSHFAMMFPNLLLTLEQPLRREILEGRLPDIPTLKVATMYVTMVFSLFKSSINASVDDCDPVQTANITLPPETVEGLVRENLQVLDLVFFSGLFGCSENQQPLEH